MDCFPDLSIRKRFASPLSFTLEQEKQTHLSFQFKMDVIIHRRIFPANPDLKKIHLSTLGYLFHLPSGIPPVLQRPCDPGKKAIQLEAADHAGPLGPIG